MHKDQDGRDVAIFFASISISCAKVPTDQLDEMLVRLKLSGIRDQLDNLLDEAARANLSARETLMLLCERSIARKDHRRYTVKEPDEQRDFWSEPISRPTAIPA